MTKVAWSKKRDEITKVIPGAQRKTFVFNLRRKQYDELLVLAADTDVERKRSATIRQQLARLVQP